MLRDFLLVDEAAELGNSLSQALLDSFRCSYSQFFGFANHFVHLGHVVFVLGNERQLRLVAFWFNICLSWWFCEFFTHLFFITFYFNQFIEFIDLCLYFILSGIHEANEVVHCIGFSL